MNKKKRRRNLMVGKGSDFNCLEAISSLGR
jgi:hypothetical protein